MNTRTIGLIGEENFKKISNLKIAVFGLGGVGGTCFEALVRSGVNKFYIQDFDEVNNSNLNRQILFTSNNINEKKCSSALNFAKLINKDIKITQSFKKLDSNDDLDFLKGYDFVVDAIDDIKAKVHLISYCLNNNIKIISSLGMGNRLDPSKVVITTLNKTTSDPLAKKLRYELKKNLVDISKLVVSFSKEEPIMKSSVVNSLIFTPSSSGLNIAYYIINTTINN